MTLAMAEDVPWFTYTGSDPGGGSSPRVWLTLMAWAELGMNYSDRWFMATLKLTKKAGGDCNHSLCLCTYWSDLNNGEAIDRLQ